MKSLTLLVVQHLLSSHKKNIEVSSSTKDFENTREREDYISSSAVVDKRFVNKIGDKTAILRKYMSTKILVCRHNVLFSKRKDTFKKQNIDK